MKAEPPLFSIVTPALNCRRYIPRNLVSVRSQGLAASQIEHWVIDGGSSDGTVEFLREQAHVNWISEKDRGLSDAVNKGIRRATGSWILWLNADDELAPGALRYFIEAIRAYPDTWLFCGNERVFRYDGTLETVLEGWDYNLGELLGSRTSILQAATFVHRKVYDKVGLLDVECRYAMDYEWVVRAVHQFRCQPLPEVLAHYHRREGSIMDAHMADHYRTFLRVRRRYHKGHLSPGELRIRSYLMAEPLRRIGWLRRTVRWVKRQFGAEPAHPIG